jgi:hypothetical protein
MSGRGTVFTNACLPGRARAVVAVDIDPYAGITADGGSQHALGIVFDGSKSVADWGRN